MNLVGNLTLNFGYVWSCNNLVKLNEPFSKMVLKIEHILFTLIAWPSHGQGFYSCLTF